MARAYGIPPWSIEDPERPPTEAAVSRWYWREQILSGLGI